MDEIKVETEQADSAVTEDINLMKSPEDKKQTTSDGETSDETAQTEEMKKAQMQKAQMQKAQMFPAKDVRIQEASETNNTPLKATCDGQTSEETAQTDEMQDQTTPEKDVQTQEASEGKTQLKWSPGSRCRAVFSDDGMAYPAVVLWVKGDRCRIRYEKYDNEEELGLSCLLSPNELHGPRRTHVNQVGDRPRSRYKADTQPGDSRSFQKKPVANPVSPPPVTTAQDSVTCSNNNPPPSLLPPPLLTVEHSNDSDLVNGTLSSMLQAWYMCGYRTGRYMVSVTCNCPPLPPPLLAMEHGKDMDAVAVATLSSTLQAWYMCGYRTGRYMTLLQQRE